MNLRYSGESHNVGSLMNSSNNASYCLHKSCIFNR